ncbi:MAG: tetratricopeptide repeat protein [Clostridiales bacterium]|nr:tetratricopeptide repeat protein [Clostridiales bacterium]
MLSGGLQKKHKIIGVFIFLIMLLIIAMIYKNYKKNNTYEEQTVMADEYMQEEKYEKAIKAYNKALTMNESEQELLSIRLAEAYIGLNEYDKALEVLRASYNKSSSLIVKEKIEEVTAEKIEYQFNQIISRANTYYSNKEYDKAIAEYNKAKLIKSKDITTYNGIAKSYIEKGEYHKAREEVIAGLQLTQSDELNKMLNLVDTYIMRDRYEDILKAATEYIYQENYNESIAKYKEAIMLMPDEDRAYYGLAELYISLNDYEKAITLLKSVPHKILTRSLKELLEQAEELNNKKVEYDLFLSELYTIVSQLDISEITGMMNRPTYKEISDEDKPLYYFIKDQYERIVENVLIIYNDNRIYAGGIQNHMRTGLGIYINIDPDEDYNYYYYKGEWYNDLPHGLGKTEEVITEVSDNGEKVIQKVITDGFFDQSMESGTMIKSFYENDVEVGNIKYVTNNGKPAPLLDKDGNRIMNEDNSEYAIGIWNRGDKLTEEYYYVSPETMWGVKLIIND